MLLKKIVDREVHGFMLVTVLGMVCSLAVDAMIAKKFGAGTVSDIYVLVNTIPVLLDVIAREGMRMALVPVVASHFAAGEENGKQKMGEILGLGTLAGLAIVLVFTAPAMWLLELLKGSAIADTYREMAVTAYRVLLWMVPLSILTSIFGAFLMFSGKQGILAQRNATPAIVVILAILVTGKVEVELIAWATVAGYAVFALIVTVQAFTVGGRFPLFSWPSAGLVREIGSTVSWTFSGMIIGQLSRFLERVIAARLGEGALALYYFAFKIYGAAQTVVGSSTAIVSIGNLLKEKGESAFRAMYRRRLAMGIAMSAIVGVGSALFAEPIVRLIYGGRAFDAESVRMTAEILQILGLGMCFHGIIPILELPFFVRRWFFVVTVNAFVIAASKVIIAWWLVDHMGANGIAAGVSISAVLGVIVMLLFEWYARKKRESNA